MDKDTIDLLMKLNSASRLAIVKANQHIHAKEFEAAKLMLERSISLNASAIVMVDNQDLFEPVVAKPAEFALLHLEV